MSETCRKNKKTQNLQDVKIQFYKRRLECLEREHKLKVQCMLAEHEVRMETLKVDKEIKELELKEMKRQSSFQTETL